MYSLHVATRRGRVALRALFASVCCFSSRRVGVVSRVGAGVRVFGGGGVRAGDGSFRRVDEGVEARRAARRELVFELEAVDALQVAPVIAHGGGEARALHGARGSAAAAGLRAAAAGRAVRPRRSWRTR